MTLFGNPEAWDGGRLSQLVVQVIGVVAAFVWAFGLGFLLLWLMPDWLFLRAIAVNRFKTR